MPEDSGHSAALAGTSNEPYGLSLERAEGCYVWDSSGKRYLDLIAGISVANIGHRHPAVLSAIQKQSEKYLHTMVYGEFEQSVQLELANSLKNILPSQLNCTYLVSTGTEANEAALKLVKRYTGRSRLISFRGSYHGNTQGSMSVSGNEIKKRAFRPLLPDVHFLTFNEVSDLNQIDEKVAGVIIEPVQGDAGVRQASTAFLQALRKRCNEVGALLIYDEIQCGMGRTGAFFAFEHSGVIPDILTLAKGLGGGLPIGALISDEKILAAFKQDPMLGHITTFGGNPLSCAASKAVITVLQEENYIKEAEQKGQLFKSLLNHQKVREVRQTGLMLAVDLENEEVLSKLIDACKQAGVIVYRFLSHPYSFRLSPPLTISEEQIREGCQIINNCLDRI